MQHALLRQPPHQDEPVNGQARCRQFFGCSQGKGAGVPPQRPHSQVHGGREARVQSHVLAALELPIGERREVEKRKAHRLLQLEHPVLRQEDPRRRTAIEPWRKRFRGLETSALAPAQDVRAHKTCHLCADSTSRAISGSTMACMRRPFTEYPHEPSVYGSPGRRTCARATPDAAEAAHPDRRARPAARRSARGGRGRAHARRRAGPGAGSQATPGFSARRIRFSTSKSCSRRRWRRRGAAASSRCLRLLK